MNRAVKTLIPVEITEPKFFFEIFFEIIQLDILRNIFDQKNIQFLLRKRDLWSIKKLWALGLCGSTVTPDDLG